MVRGQKELSEIAEGLHLIDSQKMYLEVFSTSCYAKVGGCVVLFKSVSGQKKRTDI